MNMQHLNMPTFKNSLSGCGNLMDERLQEFFPKGMNPLQEVQFSRGVS